jgi:FdhD protein
MDTKKYVITKLYNGIVKSEEDEVITEYPVTLYINGVEFVSLICTPRSITELVTGFLFSEGIINSLRDLEDVHIDEVRERVDVITRNKDLYYYQGDKLQGKKTVTTACGRQKSIAYSVIDLLGTESDKINTVFSINSQEVFELVNRFNKESELFITTGGVHSCALCDRKEFLRFEEDIGRHNALDKIIGHTLLNDVNLEDKILITSGRISSEMIIKVVRARIPMLISRSAPTDAAVDMACKFNMTLIGFARGNRMNIYSGTNRVNY